MYCTFYTVIVIENSKEARKKSENHVNSKKTHSEGDYNITIFGKSSLDSTKESTRRELNVNKHCAVCTLLCSLLLLDLAELQYFLSPEFLPIHMYSYSSPFINYQKEFREELECMKASGSIFDKFSLLIYRNLSILFTEIDKFR